MSAPFVTDVIDFAVRIGEETFRVRVRGRVETPSSPRPDAARERLEAEERALRGPVQPNPIETETQHAGKPRK